MLKAMERERERERCVYIYKYIFASLSPCLLSQQLSRSRKSAPVFNTQAATKSQPPPDGLSPQAKPGSMVEGWRFSWDNHRKTMGKP